MRKNFVIKHSETDLYITSQKVARSYIMTQSKVRLKILKLRSDVEPYITFYSLYHLVVTSCELYFSMRFGAMVFCLSSFVIA